VSNVVGLSAYFHDAAACVLRDGRLVAAAQQERFSRRKHDPRLPRQAFRWCLRESGLSIADVDLVAYYEAPTRKLDRQLTQLWPHLSQQRCLQLWAGMRRPADEIRHGLGYDGEIVFSDHHLSHAASAFYFSDFREAAILTVDAVGEWATTSYSHGSDRGIEQLDEVRFPHSLGLLYSTITAYLGFAVNDGEYKVMGLAPYGQPAYVNELRTLVENGARGQFRLDERYFDFTRDDGMHAERLLALFDQPVRRRHDALTAFHCDLAKSLQVVLEDTLLDKVRYLHDRVPLDDLCMAGGVALNCVANGRITRDGPFRRVFVQPAAGDAGGALGAAAIGQVHLHGGAWREPMEHAYWGPGYSDDEITETLRDLGITGADYRHDHDALIAATGTLLIAGHVVGWFQGRMEFGPRALGARSLLADPRDPAMRDRINHIVKERESFRPFAPAVLDYAASQHFSLDHPSPFMLETCQVISPLPLPAITHVDGSARVQTVSPRHNPRFARLLEWFYARTGCPMLLNTSFNLKDEPIVASPSDALMTFARSKIDALVLGNYLVRHADLDASFVSACLAARTPPAAISDRVYTFW
jgi:carbamoyltransferase